MQSEQLNSACFHMPHYIDLLKMSLVFDWSYHNIHLLNKNYNIKCHSIFSWSFLTPNLMSLSMNAEKNFDIFFAGVKTIERIAIIDKLKKLNPTLKWFVDLEYRLTDYIKLSKILSRCKYVINIPAYKESALETHRIVKGLYSNCQILSPPSHDTKLTKELEPYVHFGKLEDLIINIDNLNKKKTISHYIQYYENPLFKTLLNSMQEFERDIYIQNAVSI